MRMTIAHSTSRAVRGANRDHGSAGTSSKPVAAHAEVKPAPARSSAPAQQVDLKPPRHYRGFVRIGILFGGPGLLWVALLYWLAR
jgi:hypothetical protein